MNACALFLSIRETWREVPDAAMSQSCLSARNVGTLAAKPGRKQKLAWAWAWPDNKNVWFGLVLRNSGEQGKLTPIMYPNSVGGIASNGTFQKETISILRSLSVERYFRSNRFQIIKKLNFSNKLSKSEWIQADSWNYVHSSIHWPFISLTNTKPWLHKPSPASLILHCCTKYL